MPEFLTPDTYVYCYKIVARNLAGYRFLEMSLLVHEFRFEIDGVDIHPEMDVDEPLEFTLEIRLRPWEKSVWSKIGEDAVPHLLETKLIDTYIE